MKIESLWRYPVKSLLGESLASFKVDARGVVGDRVFAISNSQGKFGSGKNTRRFVRMDGLFDLSASMDGDSVLISFPDGDVLESSSNKIDTKLSEYLGQEVSLTKERDISHFDDGSVHILSEEGLSVLQNSLPRSQIDLRRFRANIIINAGKDITDEALLGKVIKIGDVELEVTHKTERCRMVTMQQSDLENAPEILKSISKEFSSCFGVYASIIKPGSLSLGQELEILSPKL